MCICAFIHSFRFALSSMDMDLKDYDSRTALHISAAEGEFHVICQSAVRLFSEGASTKSLPRANHKAVRQQISLTTWQK